MNNFEAFERSHNPGGGSSEQAPVLPICKYQAESGRCRFRLISDSSVNPSLAVFSDKDLSSTGFTPGRCGASNDPELQSTCDQFNNPGRVFNIGPGNTSSALPAAIRMAESEDVIVVSNDAQRELGRIAQGRMRPQSTIKFVVDPLG